MPRWNRSGRYYGRNRRGYGYIRTRNFYRSTRAKSYGNMRAAKQQADQSTVTINVPSTIEAANYTSLDIDGTSTVNFGVYPLNIFEQLRKSEFYKSYASMYDEFKVDRVKVKLLPTEFTYTVTTGADSAPSKFRNVTVYTAWDRTGLSKDQVRILATHASQNSEKIGIVTRSVNPDNQQVTVNDDGDGLYCIIGNDITTYSSAESRVVNPGTNTQIVRWLNPKTMEEKGQWISTGLLKQWYEGYYASKFYGLPTGHVESHIKSSDGDVEIGDLVLLNEDNAQNPTTQQAYLNHLSAANAQNPCYLIEDNAIRFKPTLLVGVYPESSAANQNNCKFNVETEVVITFRGLRKASVVAALYNGENPPPYDPDIITNQLINTFGLNEAPEGFTFGSVNVQTQEHHHLEHTFNNTDITQQQIENAAINDEGGVDIHETGIFQEQPHDQGAIINDGALTILNWGKYNLRSIGLHQMAVKPNTNEWVIPAVMNVDISLEDNQVLANNGIYNVVQGENGLEFERVVQNNNVRGLPDPTGTSIGSFNVEVPTVNNYTQPTITTNGTYTIPNGYTGFNDFSVNVNPTASQKVLTLTQNTTSEQTIYPPTGEYWSSIKYSVNVVNKYNLSDFKVYWIWKNISSTDDNTQEPWINLPLSSIPAGQINGPYTDWTETTSSSFSATTEYGLFYLIETNDNKLIFYVCNAESVSNTVYFPTTNIKRKYYQRYNNGWNAGYYITYGSDNLIVCGLINTYTSSGGSNASQTTKAIWINSQLN